MKRKLLIAIGLAISMPSIASSVSISINQKWSSTWREYVQYADVQSTTDEIEIHNLELNRGNCEYYKQIALPKKLKYGQTLSFMIGTKGRICNVLEASVTTNKGVEKFRFK